MDTLKSIALRQQQTRPDYFDDPEKARMMASILELAEEICVLHDRLDTCRRLAAEGKIATDENVESYSVSDALQAERLNAHISLFEATLAKITPK